MIIPGSGLIRTDLKKPVLQHFWAVVLTLGLQASYSLCAEAYFDEIDTIDILDCNGGDHGYPFATNFNPEINLREVSANGSYWENGHWVETELWRLNVNMTSLRLDRKICTCFIMRKSNHWLKMYPV